MIWHSIQAIPASVGFTWELSIGGHLVASGHTNETGYDVPWSPVDGSYEIVIEAYLNSNSNSRAQVSGTVVSSVNCGSTATTVGISTTTDSGSSVLKVWNVVYLVAVFVVFL
jgi:hypothetical protein